jgi:hypothetical protein
MLVFAMITAISFGSWLIVESENEEIIRYRVKAEKFLTEGKRQEARALLNDRFLIEADRPLSISWLPLINSTYDNGFEILGFYVRILAGAPDREASYEEISNLIEEAPLTFQNQVKSRYLADLNSVPGVNVEYMKKYGLLVESENTN